MLANLKVSLRRAQKIFLLVLITFCSNSSQALSLESTIVRNKSSCSCEGISRQLQSGKVKPELAEWLIRYVSEHPKDAMAHIELGQYYENKRLYYPALEEYREADQLKPNDSKALHAQIRILLNLRLYADAESLIVIAKARFPNDPAIDLSKYFLLGVSGQKEAAEQFLASRLQQTNSSPEIKILKAALLSSNGKFEESLSYCNLALKQKPNSLPCTLLKGSILIKLGRHREAFDTVSGWFENTPYSAISSKFYIRFLINEKHPDLLLEPVLALLATYDPTSDVDTKQARLLAMSYLTQFSHERAGQLISKVASKLNDGNKASTFQKRVADIFDTFGQTDIALEHYKDWLNCSRHSLRDHLFVANYAQTEVSNWQAARGVYEAGERYASQQQERNYLDQQLVRLKHRQESIHNDASWEFKSEVHKTWKKWFSPLSSTIEILKLRAEIVDPYSISASSRTDFNSQGLH